MAIKKSELRKNPEDEERTIDQIINQLEAMIDATLTYHGLVINFNILLHDLPDDTVQEEIIRRYRKEGYSLTFDYDKHGPWISIYC